MEENKEVKAYPGFNSHILLPIIFILTAAVTIMFLVVADFASGLKPLVVYFYLGITLVYSAISIFDIFKKDSDKKGKKKMFILIMSIINLLGSIAYLIVYLVTK